MNWLPIITKLLLAVNVLVSILLIFVVLLQRPKNEGLGAAFGGDTTSNLFGAQTTNVLANITRWLGGIFFALTLILSILYAKQEGTEEAKLSYINKRIEEDKKAAEKAKEAEEAAKAAAAATAPAEDATVTDVKVEGDASKSLEVTPAPAPVTPDASNNSAAPQSSPPPEAPAPQPEEAAKP